MEIKLKSIHANVLNDNTDYVLNNLQARMEVRYNQDIDGSLNLNYQVIVSEKNTKLLVLKCVFGIRNYNRSVDKDVILDQAVNQLQDRIEIILGLVSEEMGFSISQDMVN